MESEEWSAVRAWNFQGEYLSLDHETSDGDKIEVTTWMDFAADASGGPDSADPIRHRCDSDRLTCEEAGEAGLAIVAVQNEDHSEGDLIGLCVLRSCSAVSERGDSGWHDVPPDGTVNRMG